MVSLWLVFSSCLVYPQSAYTKHLEIAKSYLNLKEIDGNNGWNDKQFQSYAYRLGWRLGYSWCGYFVGVCLDSAKALLPKPYGLARNYFTKGYKTAYIENANPEAGDILIWKKGTTITGHVAFIYRVIKKYLYETIEGNTSSGDKGSQSNGDGVYKRIRKYNKWSYFKMLGISKVKYG